MASDGRYTVLEIVPTINKDDTEYSSEGVYTDSDKIRNDNGRIETIGGWQTKNTNVPITGVARDIISWKELRDMDHYAVGTHNKLQIEQLSNIYDITPVETSVSISNAITTSAGSTTVIVSAAAHGREIGDYVYFDSVATSVGGISFQGNQYVVTSVPDNNSFWFNASTAALTTSAAAGGTTVIHYLLESGLQSNQTAFGYGAGVYGGGVYGTGGGGTGEGISKQLRQWSLDNWGEDLVACVRNRGVYYWDATNSVTTRASALSGCPVSNTAIFVHPNRYVVALGTVPVGGSEADPLEIRWSDRDDPREWAISAGTRAGSFRLQGTGSQIMGYAKTKREALVFTDKAVWSMAPLNNELVFSFNQITTETGLISQHAVAAVDDVVYWMGTYNFFRYDGRTVPIKNSIRDFVFADMNEAQKEKTYAGINSDHNEIWWFYQSNDSTTGDIDRYVKYNYQQDTWDVGTFNRTVWDDTGVFGNPIAIDENGVVYDHEIGTNADGSPMNSFIESSYFDIEDGTEMLLVDQLIPDYVLNGNLNFTITTQKWPNGPEVTKGPFSITPSTEKINFRSRGRQAKIRFSTSALDTTWGIGKPRFRVRTDGER